MKFGWLAVALCCICADGWAQDRLYYPKSGDRWETVSLETAGIGAAQFKQFLDYTFSRGKFSHEPHRTNALIVLVRGRILHEEYAHGLNANAPHYLWSITKSLANGILGRAERLGILSRDTRVADYLPELTDPRAQGMTLAHLMQMSSGIRYVEENEKNFIYSNSIYINYAWRGFEGVPSYMALQGFQYPAGKQFNYSSGDCNLSMAVLRRRFDDPEVNKGRDPQAAYNAFPWVELFSRIGMESTTLEQGGAGVFRAGSFGWSTARDMARFSLLYLRNGAWDLDDDGRIAEDERLFNPDWVAFSTSVAPTLIDRGFLVDEDSWRLNREAYGAFWWLNRPIAASGGRRPYPDLPETAVIAMGLRGQTLAILPSRQVVVLRFGGDVMKKKIDRHKFFGLLMASLRGGTKSPAEGRTATTGYDFPEAGQGAMPQLGELFLRSIDGEIVFDDPLAMAPAKDLCSCLFVMKMDEAFCAADGINLRMLRGLGLASMPIIDYDAKSVTVSNRIVPLFDYAPLLGLFGPSTHTATASYVNEHLGCMVSKFTAPWRGPIGVLDVTGDKELAPTVRYFE